jgi:hypothetical protein
MTLDTAVYVQSPCDKEELWSEIIRIITRGTMEALVDPDKDNTRTTTCGQGLDAWTFMHWGDDDAARMPEPETCDEWCKSDCDRQHEPAHFIKLSFDTGYSFSRPYAGDCSTLHAGYLVQLATFFAPRSISWSWKNEYNGDIHEGLTGIAEFLGNGEHAKEWFQTQVLPAMEIIGEGE